MTGAFKTIFVVIILVSTFVAPVTAGPLEDATTAFYKRDYVTALRLFRALADRGDSMAEYRLGNMYRFGWGVKEDYAEALKWFRLAAGKGNALAQYSLGNMYERPGAEQNFIEAIRWYRAAADRGPAFAQNNSERDSENGSAWAQYRLGVLSYFGLSGVAQDYTEAMRWYRLAADQGYERAQYALGQMYFYGTVKQDYAEALKWYRLAAEQDYNLAKLALGRVYSQGAGVPQDFVIAYMWIELFATAGPLHHREVAEIVLVDIIPHMTPAQIAEAKKLARESKRTKRLDN